MARWVRGAAIGSLLAVGLVCVGGVGAQEEAKKAERPLVSPSETRGKRMVAVNVLNEEGQQVVGLKAENFRGKYRGKAVRIVSAEWDAGPRRVVILLDRSGSMEWGNKQLIARKAAEDLVFYGPVENQVALIWFSTKPDEIVPLKAGRQHVVDRLAEAMKGKTVPAEGRTALLDALMEGLRLLEPAQFGDALYVVTDAGENASRSRDREVREAILCSGVRVYFLLFLDPDRSVRGAEYARGPGLAEELSKETGGFSLVPEVLRYGSLGRFQLSPEELSELGKAVRWLYELMAGYYRVEVELPEEVDKTRGWELEVVGSDGKKMKGVRVVYPRKLAACGGERE
ncbi:MAG: vWA domain-containing protein [bacterium]